MLNRHTLTWDFLYQPLKKKLGSERRIPFEITADPFYSKQNMEHLNQSIQNVKEGKTTLKEHELIEVE